MYYFCTYFDKNYLIQGLALYQSLYDNCTQFKLWILCLDDDTYNIIKKLNLLNIVLISLEDLERDDILLLEVKKNRSIVEYYFTCSPCLPLYILKYFPEVNMITYLDSDLYFFNNPAPLFDELGNGSIGIIRHRFSVNYKNQEIYGIYNVGWISFRRDEHALSCLNRWREQCIDWCYDKLEYGRFADQKYLDEWPKKYKNVIILEHPGANLARWNISNYKLCKKGNDILVNDRQLIFYHFQGLKKIFIWLYNPGWNSYNIKSFKVLRKNIYIYYIKKLFEINEHMLCDHAINQICVNVRNNENEETIFTLNRNANLYNLIIYAIKKIITRPDVFVDVIKGRYIYNVFGKII